MASYATTDQLRIRIQQLSTPSADQLTMMEEILEGASRVIDRFCHREDNAFAATSIESRYFTADGKSYLHIPTCTEILEVAVKTSKTATTYEIWASPTTDMAGDGDWIPARGDPSNPVYGQPPYNLLVIDLNGDYAVFLDGEGAPVVKITAQWGSPSTVPADIRTACLMQAAIWLKQFQGAMSSELGSGDLGVIVYRRRLDNNIKQILVDGGWVLPLYGGV